MLSHVDSAIHKVAGSLVKGCSQNAASRNNSQASGAEWLNDGIVLVKSWNNPEL